ncbi:hypothetical protein RvY_18798 [Ramazzottius varieornatus]|uniref:Uncharacterized protein n=1 Tax=Ramazzottius varieornatus TaxID=947166 RepID=A0A1D1WB49_RAMVA|nr:hypothetical protein RvY_18798 [Ramazzottius varieornatus]
MDSQRECASITSTDAGVGGDSQLGCLTAGQVENVGDIPGNVAEVRSTDLTSQLSETAAFAQPGVFIVDKILRYRQVRRRKLYS